MREFLLTSTSDIQAQILEMMDRIDKGAVCSNSIKGTVVRDMRKAAAITRAAMSILSLRTAAGTDASLIEQLEEMRLEMTAMRRENERLKIQLDGLRRRQEDKETIGTEQWMHMNEDNEENMMEDIPVTADPLTNPFLPKVPPQLSKRQQHKQTQLLSQEPRQQQQQRRQQQQPLQHQEQIPRHSEQEVHKRQ